MSCKTPWERSPNPSGQAGRKVGDAVSEVRSEAAPGARRHLWVPQPARSGTDTNHAPPRLVGLLPKMCLLSSVRKPTAGKDINQKTNVLVRCDCSAQTVLPSEHRLTWGMIKQARRCLQIYFLFFLRFCKPPIPEY